MLVIEKLRKNFGTRCAVKDISFSVGKGETVGLLGPNGAGKTTTIAMICGIAKADAGRVTLDGAAITPESRALKQRVGLVPQDLALYEELSPVAVPVLLGGSASLDTPAARRLSGTDREVAGRVNGRWDVASIALACPLREVETLKALRKLVRLGIADLVEPR